MEQRVQIAGINHGYCFFFSAHAFIHKITCNLQRSLRCSLAVTALQHVQFSVFNGEFHVLHITVMLFKQAADFFKFSICFRELIFHLGNRHGSTNTRNNVFTLGIHKEFAHQFVFACCGITGKCNACAGIVIQVAEYHGHNIDCCAPAVRNIIISAIYICAGVVPGTEHSFYSAHQLFFGISGEIFPDLGFVFSFELTCQFFQIFSRQFDIVGDAFLCLHLVDQLFKVFFSDLHNHVGIHLDKTAVAVVYKTGKFGIAVSGNHGFHNFIIQSEIENCVHHTRHGCPCTGADGNQQRIFQIAKLLTVDFLHFGNIFHDLCLDFVVNLTTVFIVLGTGFRRNGKSLRNRQADFGHLGKISAFAAKQFTHGSIAFSEEVQILFGHSKFLPDHIHGTAYSPRKPLLIHQFIIRAEKIQCKYFLLCSCCSCRSGTGFYIFFL